MDTHELAWAAGFYDGEGSTNYHKASYSLRMQVGQRNRELLDRFNAAVGSNGKMYRSINKSRKYPNGEYWQLVIYGVREVPRVLELLRPYLGRIKIEQAERAIADRPQSFASNWGDSPVQCRKGHDLTLPDALHVSPKGVRQCEACRQVNVAKQSAKRHALRKAAHA